MAFITFEGIEGCGKTTQIRMAGVYLQTRQVPVLVTEEPGGAPLGKHIRELLLNRGRFSIDAKAELLLFAAARAQHVREVILPAVAQGVMVLCDRFSDATVAYQGYGRGLSLELIERLNEFCAGGLAPHRTILFDLPVDVGLQRAIDRIERRGATLREDRFEHEGMAFHQKVRNGYLKLAEDHPGRFRIIDASRDVQTIFLDVCAVIDETIASGAG